HPRTRRRRQDPPGHRPGPHRHPPPPHRPHDPRRTAVQTPQSRPPGQHHRSRTPPAGRHRHPHPGRLRLTPLQEPAPTDSYEHPANGPRKKPTIVPSTRPPDEWVTLMSAPPLAQSAVDRLPPTCHELIVEGESYRKRQRPSPPQLD